MASFLFGVLCVVAVTAVWPPSPVNLDMRFNVTFCPGSLGSLAPIQGSLTASNFTGRLIADVFTSTDGRQWEQLCV
jgi:hypothetical protein